MTEQRQIGLEEWQERERAEKLCSHCLGEGYVPVFHFRGEGGFETDEKCLNCMGKGFTE